MGFSDDDVATSASLLLFGSICLFEEDSKREFRTSKRYSGVSWDPTGGISPTPCSSGGKLNLHNLRRRANAFEKMACAQISSPVARLHEMFGTHDPNTSQIDINEPASCGTKP